jgi:hypothetical protein
MRRNHLFFLQPIDKRHRLRRQRAQPVLAGHREHRAQARAAQEIELAAGEQVEDRTSSGR